MGTYSKTCTYSMRVSASHCLQHRPGVTRQQCKTSRQCIYTNAHLQSFSSLAPKSYKWKISQFNKTTKWHFHHANQTAFGKQQLVHRRLYLGETQFTPEGKKDLRPLHIHHSYSTVLSSIYYTRSKNEIHTFTSFTYRYHRSC